MPARSVCLVTLSLSEAGPGRFGGQVSVTDIYHTIPYHTIPYCSNLILLDRMRSDRTRSTKSCQWRSSCPQHQARPVITIAPRYPSQTSAIPYHTLFGDATLGQGTSGAWHVLPSISMTDSVTRLRYAVPGPPVMLLTNMIPDADY